jgi:WD40 repeat protein
MGGILCLQFSPTGKQLISGGSEKLACLWNSKQGDKTDLREHKAAVNSSSFIDENSVITSSLDGEMIIWRHSKFMEMVSHPLTPQPICCFAIIKPRNMVVTGGLKSIYLWYLESN